jgi:ubiquinone/menaquinone biosynthesis C-methylase UbiE
MRFSSFFANQAKKPTGWFGRLVMSRIFDIGNARLNRLVYEILSPQTGDHILEIGSGTGKLLEKIARQVEGCIVEGIDFSDTMVSISRRKNRKHIEKGKVFIHKGNIDDVSLTAEMYTKTCSVNTIYFWPNPEITVRNIVRLLKPGGILVLGFEDITQLEQRQLDTDVFRFYRTSDVETLLIEAGFTGAVTTDSIRVGSSVFHCTVAIK